MRPIETHRSIGDATNARIWLSAGYQKPMGVADDAPDAPSPNYYELAWPNSTDARTGIYFQSGDPEKGVNGITNEIALAILIDRIEHLHEAVPSPHNIEALDYLRKARAAFDARSQERAERGVTGTNNP